MTNEIQQNRYDRMIRRVAGIIGPGSKVAEVITELFPMIDLEHPPSELYLLGGTVLGMGGSNLLAAAGETPKIQVFNPAGSNQVVTVTALTAGSSVTTNMRVSRDATALASGIGTQVARDTRQIATSLPTAAIFQESSVGFNNANMIWPVVANTPFVFPGREDLMVLAPGTGCTVGTEAAAGRLILTFLWRERPAEPSELSL